MFTLLLLSGLCLATAQSALGEPKTIVVPDDYTSIQDAISNASDGDTIFVKGGTYQERQLVINKTLTLIGENPPTTKIVLSPPVGPYGPLGTFGIDYPIKIEANNVTLSGFTITANGERPVLLSNGGNVVATGTGTRIIGNIIETGLTAIGDQTCITNNTIDDKSHYNYASLTINGAYQIIIGNAISGIWVEKSECNIITQNNITGTNGPGVPIYGAGIQLRSTTKNQIFTNYIISSGPCVIIDCYIGTGGLQTRQSDNNTFYHNNFVSNSTIIDQVGYGVGNYSVKNIWDNNEEGNYWSDYNGTDANKDGVGDAAYVIDENNQDNNPLVKPIAVSQTHLPSPTPTSTSESPPASPSIGPQPEPFPTVTIIAASAATTVVIAGLLVYHKKRKHEVDGGGGGI